MHEFEQWVHEHFSVVEIDSVSRTYSAPGPPSWRSEWRQLTHDLDPGNPGDWWWMVCIMDLRRCLTPEMRVLDLGCGPGWPSIALSPFVREIVAVDASELALELITENIRRREILNIQVMNADALSLPFTDNSFDAVITSELLDVVRDPARVAAEMFRVVKPGGSFVSWVQNFNYILHGQQEVWLRSVEECPYGLIFSCHRATLDPPQSTSFDFRLDPRHPAVQQAELTTDSANTTAEELLAELQMLQPALAQEVAVYHIEEFTAETAAAPFTAAGFVDVSVSPLDAEMCYRFAEEQSCNHLLPETMEQFSAQAANVLSLMDSSNFSTSWEMTVKGRRPA